MIQLSETKSELIHHWDSIAGKKEFTSDLDLDHLYKYADEDAKILDYGCGYGRLYPLISKKKSKFQYVGFDPSQKMIEAAKNNYPDVKFHDNFTTLREDTPENGFDVVLLVSVLTAVPNNLQQKELLDNICALLNDNGILIVNDFIVNRDQRNLDRYSVAREKYNYPYGVFELEDGMLLRHHTEIYLHTLLEECFEVLQYENGVFKTMNGNFSNAAKIVARKKD